MTVKERWLAALRSGDYKQGKDSLKTEANTFCCLGVLCDVVKDDLGAYWSEVEPGAWRKSFMVDGVYYNTEYPPYEVNELIPTLTMGQRSTLIRMNDTAGSVNTFAVIADYIEENL